MKALEYNEVGLRSNPFAQENMDVEMVNRNQDWTNITRVLTDQLRADGVGYSVIHGDYGMGKTFTLIKLEEWVSHLTIDGANNLPIRLRTADAKVPQTYVANLLIRINLHLGRKRLAEIAERASDYLDSIEERTIRNVFQKVKEGDESGFKWLWGRRLSPSESRGLEADFKSDDPKEAPMILFEILRILRAANYNGIVVMFDELEYVLSSVGEAKIASIIHELQSIWDDFGSLSREDKAKMARFVGIFASSPDSWQRFIELAEKRMERTGGGGTETFLRRIPEDAFTNLTPLLGEDHVRQFMSERIMPYRAPGYHGDELSPFTKDFVPFIARISLGIPGKIIDYCGVTLRHAISNGQPSISGEYASDVLKRYGLIAEAPPEA